MNDNFYIPFDKFILRTPLFPFVHIQYEDYTSPLFEEALFIASSELYKEKVKKKVSDKINKALYKYYSRASTRSTPFGLFATCSIGTINSDNNHCVISKPDNIIRHTRLDMNFLCALIQHLESLPHIQNNLLYFINDSIYSTGDKLRYVEYYFKGLRKVHQIQEVSKTEYLEKILNAAKFGNKIRDLAQNIKDDDISIEESTAFVMELIDNQILKSELEANLTGDDVLFHTIQVLQNINEDIPELQTLINISKTLNELDRNLYHDENLYKKLFDYINSFKIKFDDKYLIQTDAFRNSKSFISTKAVSELNDLINFLIRFNYSDNKRLADFARVFTERYEEEEIPLLEALDTDIGIGYPVSVSSDSINPLLDDIIFPNLSRDEATKLTSVETLLVKKFQQNLTKINKSADVIYLDENDIAINNIDLQKLTPTCNVMFQIIKNAEKGNGCYRVKSVVGTTAASLLGRFCYLDKNIYNLTIDICEKEQKLLSHGIVAEIVHLPDSRIGNIAFRPLLRDFEVHYLAHSGADKEASIPASDLVVGVKYGSLYIKYKTLNKIIIPRLSNAHNYISQGLPVYQFLCDMQSCEQMGPEMFSINNILNLFCYAPRICYKNFILYPRTWIISESDALINGSLNFDFLNKKGVPDKILIKDFDNDLYIDMLISISREVLIDILKKRKKIVIEEFLYDDQLSIITDGESNYCGEFIVPFYKKTL